MNRPRLGTWVLAAGALLFLLGGCGDDDKKANPNEGEGEGAVGEGEGEGVAEGEGEGEGALEGEGEGEGATEGEGEGAVPADLALLGAFTQDGTLVYVRFSAEPTPATLVSSSFAVKGRDGADSGVTVVEVALDEAPSLAGEFRARLTLSGKLAADGGPYTVEATGLATADGHGLDPAQRSVPLTTTLHLALIWHQHQPVYIDPEGDYLRGPWVRKHAVKDYYDMAAMLEEFPTVHVMVNLTPVLLMQLEKYYLDRLAPFIDLQQGTIDTAGYFGQKGADRTTPITDPWVDMLLKPTPQPAQLTPQEVGWFYKDIWSNFSISEVMIARFPEYLALKNKANSAPESLTQDDLLQMKGWFELAWFDPDFLHGPVTLPSGDIVDLSDLLTRGEDDTYTLKVPFTEELCQRLVIEDFKIMSNVVAIHKQLRYDAATKQGQIEVMTTPYYHPILPLLTDTDLAKMAMPNTDMSLHRFQHPEDAEMHVAKALKMYDDQFDAPVTGMWPAEGSVAQAVVPIFAAAGVKWLATDRKVLERSTPQNQPIYSPYQLVSGLPLDAQEPVAIVFRDTEISDNLGFQYQGATGEENVRDLLKSLRRHPPAYGAADRMLTVVLDGENAWEWYRKDNDAKVFLRLMYTTFEKMQQDGELRTTTVSEYLSGNETRGVAPHPANALPKLDELWAGSWIYGDFSTWYGEAEENAGWDYLWKVRADLEQFETTGKVPRHAADAPEPAPGDPGYCAYMAWESMYAAEGSDWFWWYGDDQTAMGGDQPFDRIYRELLKAVYRYAKECGVETEIPNFPPILRYCMAPAGPLTGEPTIDGQFDPDDGRVASVANEWTQVGSGVCVDPDSDAEVQPADDINTYYYGVTADTVYVALRMNDELREKVGQEYSIHLYFSHKHLVPAAVGFEVEQDPFLAESLEGEPLVMRAGGAARVVTFTSDAAGSFGGTVAVPVDDKWGEPTSFPELLAAAIPDATDRADVLELAVPFSLLNHTAGDPLELIVVVAEAGQQLDRAPNSNSIILANDRSLMVEVTFVLDATGEQLPLTAVKAIDNPPPPVGTGKVFIVGNLPTLGNWTPNQVQMYDDGTHGDATAGDNRWTFQLQVPPMTGINYKYTIGASGEGWGPTEEYPLTNRGFTATDRNGDLKMVLHDVFADRPGVSGELPELTEVVND